MRWAYSGGLGRRALKAIRSLKCTNGGLGRRALKAIRSPKCTNWAFVVAGSCLFGAAGCSNDEEPLLSPAPNEDCAAGATYENFARPFLLDWCIGCHSSTLPEERRQKAPLASNFDTAAGIEAYGSKMLAYTKARTMPPAGGPKDADRALFEQWIECGMPGLSADFDPPPPDPDPDPPECAPPSLPPEHLPRCQASTRDCIDACSAASSDPNEISKCRDGCLSSDQTPPVMVDGLPVNCVVCTYEQTLACAASAGCHDQVSALWCCIEECFPSNGFACLTGQCASQSTAYFACVYVLAPNCTKEGNPYVDACYGS